MRIKQEEYIIKRHDRMKMDDLLSDETIFSLANGSLGTRGHFAEGYGTDDFPITLLNGFYNKYPLRYEENYTGFAQQGQMIVTLPDASFIQLITDDGKIDLKHAKLVSLKRKLHMRQGFTERCATYITKNNHHFYIKEQKVVVSNRNQIVIKLSVSSPDYAGPLKINSYLRMPKIRYIYNNDPRLPDIRRNLELTELKSLDKVAYLKAITTNTKQKINVSVTHDIDVIFREEHEAIIGSYDTNLSPEKPFEMTKYALYTTPKVEKRFHRKVDKVADFIYPIDQYIKEETTNRKKFWANSPIYISDKDLEMALRYNVYQLHLNAGKHNETHIAAKGITGEGYEGHYFWDTEAYMVPYFILTNPNKARKILKYRYLTLDQSRREARNLGVNRGAKIAWRTINGMESSAYFLAGSAQIHINSDVALAYRNYYYATNDKDFMIKYGMEVILETALFLLDYGFFDDQNQFHIYQVTGPDEYTVLVNDNYYTNLVAKQHFKFAYEFASTYQNELTEVFNKVNINMQTLELFMQASRNMTLLIDEKRNINKQDASFLDKKDYDLSRIPREHFPLLLSYHPIDLYRHQIIKQADGILALVLQEHVDENIYLNSFNYYLQRTTHDSSLSRCIYGIAGYKLGQSELAYDYFKKVCDLDFRDSHNRTQHGLHVANLGGSYLVLAYGLLGLRFKEVLTLNPVKQSQLNKIKTKIKYLGSDIWIELTSSYVKLKTNKPIQVSIFDKIYDLEQTLKIKL